MSFLQGPVTEVLTALCLARLCQTELRERRLPNRVVCLLVLLAAARGFLMLTGGHASLRELLARELLGLLPSALCLVLACLIPHGLGMGDVKLLLALGLLLGVRRCTEVLAWALLTAVGYLTWMRLVHRKKMAVLPLAPFFLVGYVTALVRAWF